MKKGTWINILLIMVLITGLSLLLYPTVSNFWNQRYRNRAISVYGESVDNLDDGRYDELWSQAIAYNQSLTERGNEYILTDEQKLEYGECLNLLGDGIMGYVEIPKIDVMLPIYHGTDESILQIAVGHLEWTSLPTGGESTHCVISGHRGLPSAKLFTDIVELAVGDRFMLNVLNEVLTYEVDQILVVEPTETDDLLIEEGKDLCTLVTCTPYGVNSHRLLVRGHRVESAENQANVRVTADAIQIEPMFVAAIVFVPMLFLLMIVIIVVDSIKKRIKRKR